MLNLNDVETRRAVDAAIDAGGVDSPAPAVDPLTVALETESCSRCGGGGHYSYCQTHGTRCFKCGGSGKTYTRRAQAALEYARKLRTVKASEVQVGWKFYVSASPMGGYRPGWYTVTECGLDFNASRWLDQTTGEWRPHYSVNTKVCGHSFSSGDSEVQAVETSERLVEIKALMLQYQATLNKKGEVSRRRR
jgi:hypothetical protein